MIEWSKILMFSGLMLFFGGAAVQSPVFVLVGTLTMLVGYVADVQ